jgi:hypothetical protein
LSRRHATEAGRLRLHTAKASRLGIRGRGDLTIGRHTGGELLEVPVPSARLWV